MRVCRAAAGRTPTSPDFCTCGEYLRWEPTNFVAARRLRPPTVRAAAARSAGGGSTSEPDAAPASRRSVGRARARRRDGGPTGAVRARVTGDAPPGAAVLMLRLPDDAGASDGAGRDVGGAGRAGDDRRGDPQPVRGRRQLRPERCGGCRRAGGRSRRRRRISCRTAPAGPTSRSSQIHLHPPRSARSAGAAVAVRGGRGVARVWGRGRGGAGDA